MGSTAPLPPDLQKILDDIDATDRAADTIVAGFTDETIRAAAAIDANRATFRNPFFSLLRISVATALHVIPAHDRRHLWQAEQVAGRVLQATVRPSN